MPTTIGMPPPRSRDLVVRACPFGYVRTLHTSSHVLDEAVTLTRARTGSYDDARRIADRIRGANDYLAVTELLVVSRDRLRDALDAFDRYRDYPLSFTDATTVALMEEHAIDHLLSFDGDFDGIVDRLEPGEL